MPALSPAGLTRQPEMTVHSAATRAARSGCTRMPLSEIALHFLRNGGKDKKRNAIVACYSPKHTCFPALPRYRSGCFMSFFAVVTVLYALHGYVSPKVAHWRSYLTDVETGGVNSTVVIDVKTKPAAVLKAARAQIFSANAQLAAQSRLVSMHKELMGHARSSLQPAIPLNTPKTPIPAVLAGTAAFVKREGRLPPVVFVPPHLRPPVRCSPLRAVFTAPLPADVVVSSTTTDVVITLKPISSPPVSPTPAPVQYVSSPRARLIANLAVDYDTDGGSDCYEDDSEDGDGEKDDDDEEFVIKDLSPASKQRTISQPPLRNSRLPNLWRAARHTPPSKAKQVIRKSSKRVSRGKRATENKENSNTV
ncbi:hypothetical protein FB45DRAFT_1150256 [Roridomyces roridus]|uniref:Uncharacterized protein n=1 Tax=Roridomyces roridus TaxID=1738132 RepID=A0AAD7BT50_9AGAR|nr:hypothetical protein FB45DRAFT_1150256 [Roridomyces roridus]